MNKKFFWLKLQNDFFNREEIRIIEESENGKDYIIFYLKLLLKSIESEGKLYFRNTIPYSPEMLSSVTNTNIDTVKVAVGMFLDLGLMQKWDDGTLFMVETENMIGSETNWAKIKRKKREKLKNEVQKLSSTSVGLELDNVQKSLDNVQSMSNESPKVVQKLSIQCPADVQTIKSLDNVQSMSNESPINVQLISNESPADFQSMSNESPKNNQNTTNLDNVQSMSNKCPHRDRDRDRDRELLLEEWLNKKSKDKKDPASYYSYLKNNYEEGHEKIHNEFNTWIKFKKIELEKEALGEKCKEYLGKKILTNVGEKVIKDIQIEGDNFTITLADGYSIPIPANRLDQIKLLDEGVGK